MNADVVENQLHAPEAENDLIAAILDARPEIQSTIPDLLPQVEPEDFYDTHCGGLWAAARAVAARGEVVTLLALIREKITAPMRERISRAEGEHVTHVGMFRAAERVKGVAYSRRMAQATKRMLIAIAEQSPSEALEVVHKEVELLADAPREDSTTIEAAVDEYQEWAMSDNQTVFTPTPWADINELFNGGLEAGRLYVVGGRPGQGKSVVLTNVVLKAAEVGRSAILFSLEMTRREVVSRLVAAGANVNLSRLLGNSPTDAEHERERLFLSRLREMPMAINDATRMTTVSIHAACRAFKRQHGAIGVVAVDYLQLLQATDLRAPRHEQVGQMTRDLKLMSKELGCAVLVACQLNRQAVDRGPRASDLRESGGIENDADGIILLNHPLDDQGNPNGDIELLVVKNRSGPSRTVTGIFVGSSARIDGYRRGGS